MPNWYLMDEGPRANELILVSYTESGLINTVASAFPSRQGYIYKLYPVNYKGLKSINRPTTVSIYDIEFRRGKNI